MFEDAAQFLFRVVCELVATAFWLRFYMQWSRVPFSNPFAQFIVRVTDFAVRPLRRIIPGLLGLDWASLLLFLLCEFLWAIGSHALAGFPFLVAGAQVWPGFLLLTLAAALNLVVYIAMGLVIIQVLISWINPYSPVAPVFYALAKPLLKPFKRFIPTIGGIDLSPMVALILLQLRVIAPIAGLERYALKLIW
jgi:YggT family protein